MDRGWVGAGRDGDLTRQGKAGGNKQHWLDKETHQV